MALPTSTSQLVNSLEKYDNVISWINGTLVLPEDLDASAPVDLTELDQHITQLVATLDIACEDTSLQLERIIEDVSRGIPRLTYDLHFMKDGALTLQSTLTDVLERSKAAVPEATSAALDNLLYLDTIKGRMEASREVLREAESWSSLEHEVTSLIAERSYAKAAERLSEANKSMVVFQNTPDYDPRRTLMVNLQNQLEASLSSALLSAINTQDAVVCKEYYSIFSVIQRESEFRNYYNASRRSSLISMWQAALLSDCAPSQPSLSENSAQRFSEFLQKFYASFLALLNAERTPICSIFPDPATTLSQFISSTLSSLQPTFTQRLSSLSSYHGDASLTHLISVLRVTEEFAAGVEKVMEKIRYASIAQPQRRLSNEKPSTHVRRRSSRMSISWRPDRTLAGGGGIAKAVQEITDSMEWDQELFQPFLDFQVDYASYERRFLEQCLRDIISSDARERVQDTERPRLFRERAVDIFGVAEGTLTHCKAFTHGYGATGLVQALDGFFQSFVDMWRADLQTESHIQSSTIQNSVSDGDLADLDYTAQDWSDIQLSLHLLASARTVFERMTVFETKLRSTLSQLASQFQLAQSDPINHMVAASRGESQLLEQSTLNSAELQALLDNIDNDAFHAREPTFLASTNLRQPVPQQGVVEPLLTNARRALYLFAQTCQVSLQKTILSPLRNHLILYVSSPAWNSPGDPKKRTVSNDLQVPTFSLSPSDTVQRVAEGLLNLPRLFEVYADDDALAFSLQTLPHVDPELFKGFGEPSPETPSQQQSHRRRSSVSHVQTKQNSIDPEMVSSAWLLSLGQTFLAHLVTSVLPTITTLSLSGAAQLTSDLEYLSNIVRALNVENDDLDNWKKYITLDDEEGKQTLATTDAVDPILRQVAKMRGWQS